MFFACQVVFNLSSIFSLNGLDYYWLQFQMFATPKYYLAVVVTIAAAIWFDYLCQIVIDMRYDPLIEEALPEGAYKHVAIMHSDDINFVHADQKQDAPLIPNRSTG